MPFSAEGDVETPSTWECRQHGVEATLVNGYRGLDPDKPKQPKTHWEMLLERRSIPELEELLEQRLAELVADRKIHAATRTAQSRASRRAANA